MPKRGLTEKQQRFVEAYIGPALGNATEAARLAGYRGNAKTLESVGRENLGKPGIHTAVAAAQAETRAKAKMDRAEILDRLAAIARGEGTEPHVLRDGSIVNAPPNFSAKRGALMDVAKLQGLLIERFEFKAADAIGPQLEKLRAKMSAKAFEELLVAIVGEDEDEEDEDDEDDEEDAPA